MYPVVYNQDNGSVAIPSQLMDAFASMSDQAFNGFGGGPMRFLRSRGTGFTITDGQSEEQIPFNGLIAVLLGAETLNHAVWYKNKFQEGQAAAPDLVWHIQDFATFPDALPPEARVKASRGAGRETWDFGIKRRTVWAQIKRDANGQDVIDFDYPFICDIPASSLFGKSTVQGAYTWAELAAFCRKRQGNGTVLHPYMFPMQIVPDNKNTSVLYFRPGMMANGQPFIFAPELLQQIYETAQSDIVRNLVTVKEKLTYDGAVSYAQKAPAASPAPQAAAPQGVSTPAQPQPDTGAFAAAAPSAAPAASAAPQDPQATPQPAPVSQAAPQPAPAQPAQDAAAPQGTMDLLTRAQAFMNNKGKPEAETGPATGDNVVSNLMNLAASFK